MQKYRLLCVLSLILVLPLVAQDSRDCTTLLTIAQIQGDGDIANCLDQSVVTEGSIVTGVGNLGFFIQSQTPDDNPATSEGIYVLTNYPPKAWGVNVGDIVKVEGRVKEFYSLSEISVAGKKRVQIISEGAALPEPVDLFTVDPSQLESLEGMYVAVTNALITAPTNQFDEFGISLTGKKGFREPGIETDITPQFAEMGLPEWDLNKEIVEVDPWEMGFEVEQVVPGGHFTGVGNLSYAFQDYQFWPSDYTIVPTEDILLRPARVREEGEYSIGTQNVENLYDLRDDPATNDSTFEDYVPDTEDDYQLKLKKLTAQIVQSLNAPDVLALQEVEGIDALNDLVERIAQTDPTVVYEACLIEGNDPRGIDSAFIWRPERVTVNACETMSDSATAVGVYGGGQLHDRPPLVLDVTLVGAAGSINLLLVNLHIKSLSGNDTTAVQLKRMEQAIDVGEYVQAAQLEGYSVMILGDFNAFYFSDGLVDVTGIIQGTAIQSEALHGPDGDLVEPNLVNLIERVPQEERYSFYFNSMAQQLEQTLITADLDAMVSGIEHSRGNADSIRPWDLEDNGPLRSADHDGVVVYLKP